MARLALSNGCTVGQDYELAGPIFIDALNLTHIPTDESVVDPQDGLDVMGSDVFVDYGTDTERNLATFLRDLNEFNTGDDVYNVAELECVAASIRRTLIERSDR